MHIMANLAIDATVDAATGSVPHGNDSWLQKISIVVLTHNRQLEVLRTLGRISRLRIKVPLIVVDNASEDGTPHAIARVFPDVTIVTLSRNIGAAARNAGVRRVATDYVAFCDDDTWWAEGALERAVQTLDAYPRLGVLSCRVLVGEHEIEDETCRRMSASPLRIPGQSRPALIGFMAGASVFRTEAFRQVGGYEPRFFIGGEEELVALDLLSHGWGIAYDAELTVHHFPSAIRDSSMRRRLIARNSIWTGWLRLPTLHACRRSVSGIREMMRARASYRDWAEILYGLRWCLRTRAVVDARIVEMLDCVAAAQSAAQMVDRAAFTSACKKRHGPHT
jgi:GT2 family glycosyltransferase